MRFIEKKYNIKEKERTRLTLKGLEIHIVSTAACKFKSNKSDLIG